MKRWWRVGAMTASWGAVAASTACAGEPGSQRIVGPDGSAMAHVHCGDDQGTCFRIAGELCPSGYDIQPVLSGRDGNFLVRCHAAAPVMAAATSSPATSVVPNAAAAAPAKAGGARAAGETWPPAHEPWPAANPWPPPQPDAVVQTPRTTSAKPIGPNGEVIDLGY